MQIDFGERRALIGGDSVKVYLFVATLGYSRRLRDLLPLLDANAGVLPELARQTLRLIAQLIAALTMQIRRIETELLAWHRSNLASQRLETIPGVGVITATALAATVRDAKPRSRRSVVAIAYRPTSWRVGFLLSQRYGVPGLRATRAQIYRHLEKGVAVGSEIRSR